jgi:hypothetical protein
MGVRGRLTQTAAAVAVLAAAVLGCLPARAQIAPVPEPLNVPKPHEVRSRIPPTAAPKSDIVEFDGSPFPYRGVNPYSQRPFMDVKSEDGRLGHSSRGGVLWEDRTFSDSRVLMHMPQGFDVRRPGVIIVFLHGNRANIKDDVLHRQRVAEQVTASRINGVLLAPQLAVNASDSSAGKFWEPFGFSKFLGEAAQHLAKMRGDPKSRTTFATMPIIVVAYSGGYVPAAWSLAKGGVERRIIGVVLLDALYGESQKYADFIQRRRNAFFVSSYTSSTQRGNEALRQTLLARDIAVEQSRTTLPPKLTGRISFLPAMKGTNHNDFVTRAWTEFPIRDVLDRLDQYRRIEPRRLEARN